MIDGPDGSSSSAGLIRAAPAMECRPWPRHVLPAASWAALAPDDVAFEALWADTGAVYALFIGTDGQPLLTSTQVTEGRYPALSPRFPAAAAPERMVRDLWGHEADGAADGRPWLDHGVWGFTRPLASRHGPPGSSEPVLQGVADGLMQIPVGPVTGGLEEAAHLRVATDGRLIHQVEARLGYGHKGTLVLVRGKPARAAARFAARLSADATVAHATAFARAVEAALGVEAPARAAVLRGVMAEVERIATHLGDLARACPHVTRLAWHREQVLRAGRHRVRPPHDDGLRGARRRRAATSRRAGRRRSWLPGRDCGGPAGDRPALGGRGRWCCARAGGGPAAFTPGGGGPGRRLRRGCAAAAGLLALRRVRSASASGGDVAARLQLRLAEIDRSMALLATGWRICRSVRSGSRCRRAAGRVWRWRRARAARCGTGCGWMAGTIGSAFFADPSWRLWPVQEAASAGARVADLALIDARLPAPGPASTCEPASEPVPLPPPEQVAAVAARLEAARAARLGRSLALFHVPTGGCGGCERELAALNGVDLRPAALRPAFRAHPGRGGRAAGDRAADAPTCRTRWRRPMPAMPEPKWVVAVGRLRDRWRRVQGQLRRAQRRRRGRSGRPAGARLPAGARRDPGRVAGAAGGERTGRPPRRRHSRQSSRSCCASACGSSASAEPAARSSGRHPRRR